MSDNNVSLNFMDGLKREITKVMKDGFLKDPKQSTADKEEVKEFESNLLFMKDKILNEIDCQKSTVKMMIMEEISTDIIDAVMKSRNLI